MLQADALFSDTSGATSENCFQGIPDVSKS